jgi:hypothetical protein
MKVSLYRLKLQISNYLLQFLKLINKKEFTAEKLMLIKSLMDKVL